MTTIARRQPPRWWFKKFSAFYWRVLRFATTAAWSFTKKHLSVSIVLGALSAAVVLFTSGPQHDTGAVALRSVGLTLAPMVLLAVLVWLSNLVWAPFRLFLESDEQIPHLRNALASYQNADFVVTLQGDPLVGDIDLGRRFVELVVTNRGKTTEFEAEIASIEGMSGPPRTPFSVRWETTDSKRCSIARGHSELLRIAAVHGGRPENKPVGSVHFFSPGDQSRYGVTRQQDSVTAITDAEVSLTLTITSLDPPVSRRWPIGITWEVEYEMYRAQLKLGEVISSENVNVHPAPLG